MPARERGTIQKPTAATRWRRPRLASRFKWGTGLRLAGLGEVIAMKRAFVFPGQGSQAVGMGQSLAAAFPAARRLFDEIDEALSQALSRLMFDGPESELVLTENAQPALMAASLAVIRVLEAEGGLDIARSPPMTFSISSADSRPSEIDSTWGRDASCASACGTSPERESPRRTSGVVAK